MQGIMQVFLETEISEQEFYDGIIRFIYCGNIRSGEYECNQYVIKKMDLDNFIVFEEYVMDKKREIHHSFSISKNDLLRAINNHAKKQGIIIRSYDWTKA